MSAHDSPRGEHRILVGVDDSDGGAAALRYATAEARRIGAGLHLLHVVPDYRAMSPMLPLIPDDLERTGRTILDRAVARAVDDLGPERVATTLTTGRRVGCLVEAAEQATTVVLGRETPSRRERLASGATTIGVAARSSCPVVAVPPGWEPGADRRRVAVGLKSTAHPRPLLQRAFREAARRDAELVVLHAWRLAGGYDDLIARRTGEQEWSDVVRTQVQPHLEEGRAAFPGVRVALQVVHSEASRALVEVSRSADLLLIERPRHRIPGAYLGGTGRVIVTASACPVEVVPAGVSADTDIAADPLEKEGQGHESR
jgi:nucleotide-binding universal stress UspA family protein